MKKSVIACLIIAGCLLLSGAIIFAAAGASVNWDFSNISKNKYESKTVDISDEFKNIQIDTDTTDIFFAPSDTKQCKVEYVDSEKAEYSISVSEGSLVIRTADDRPWYERIALFSFESPKMTIYLPEKEYKSLTVNTHTGDIDIPAGFTFESVGFKGDTSDIVCSAAVSDSLMIETTTGNADVRSPEAGKIGIAATTGDVRLNGVKAKGDVNIKSSTGDINVADTVISDSLSVESTTGDVGFDKSDAETLTVKTTTGDVEGTLLSGKAFITSTSTGDVKVPNTETGGKCEITTTTGDIEIDVISE